MSTRSPLGGRDRPAHPRGNGDGLYETPAFREEKRTTTKGEQEEQEEVQADEQEEEEEEEEEEGEQGARSANTVGRAQNITVTDQLHSPRSCTNREGELSEAGCLDAAVLPGSVGS